MGAINYGANNMGLTLGYNYNLIEEDEEFEQEQDMSFEDYQNMLIEDDCETADDILRKYHFDHYEVTVEPGHYCGFYIGVKRTYIYLDNDEERQVIDNELKELIKCYKELSEDIGGLQFYTCCGWCGCDWQSESFDKLLEKLYNNEHKVIMEEYKIESDFKTFDELREHINTCKL